MNVQSGQIGNYTIIKEVGRGSFAEVHSATDAQGKSCAVKMIYKQQTENLELPDSREKAWAEIELLSKVDHMFILKFMDSFKDPQSERWCIVTELCNGDLRQRIREKTRNNEPFEEDQILDWFTMLTSALKYLHDKKFIHRDLKPENMQHQTLEDTSLPEYRNPKKAKRNVQMQHVELNSEATTLHNVLFCDNDLLKLSDFGLAKFLIESASGTLCGSLAYMAPEVLNQQHYGSKCDIWSLGVLVYELCCLKRDFRKTGRKIGNIKYSTDLQTVVRSMLKEKPQKRPAAKALLQTKLLKDRIEHIPSRRNAEENFSFLEGVNPDAVSPIEMREIVGNMVYSQNSGSFYMVHGYSFSGFKWEEIKKTFNKQFETSIQDTTDSGIFSITLAPPDTSGGDQIYVSVGYGAEMKNVYRLGGRELEERVLLTDTSYIDDNCYSWVLASNTDRHILLIHPILTSFIYIHVKEEKHGKVDLNPLNIRTNSLERIELIGQLLILGDYKNEEVCLCELIVTECDTFIKSGNETVRIESYCGHFAGLSHVVGDEDEQVHLFTATYKRPDCTEISEYKFSLSVDDSDLNQLSTQPIHTLRMKGKLYPRCLVNVNSYFSCLIGRTGASSVTGKLTAVELLKEQVNHHVQLSNS